MINLRNRRRSSYLNQCLPSEKCNSLCFTVFTRAHGSDARLLESRDHYPFQSFRHLSKWRSLACGFKISAVGPYLLLFDCQEAFHCCLVVACINRINMISIACHRVGELCSGKPEFDNRIESGQGKSCAYSL